MKYIFSFIILLASAATVSAGGTYFPVKIVQFEVDPADNLSFVFNARRVNTDGSSVVGKCKTFTVKGYFDHNRWKKYKRPMSEKTHRESIKILKKACESNDTIFLGVMGNGLIKTKKCVYESRGLFNETENGKPVVLSVNDRI